MKNTKKHKERFPRSEFLLPFPSSFLLTIPMNIAKPMFESRQCESWVSGSVHSRVAMP